MLYRTYLHSLYLLIIMSNISTTFNKNDPCFVTIREYHFESTVIYEPTTLSFSSSNANNLPWTHFSCVKMIVPTLVQTKAEQPLILFLCLRSGHGFVRGYWSTGSGKEKALIWLAFTYVHLLLLCMVVTQILFSRPPVERARLMTAAGWSFSIHLGLGNPESICMMT